ncbi:MULTISPECIES: class I adenylate-forming enzyme family protein [Sphingopyxis]|uniref:class I adenylate-forming enzyme family protein n=1 Tax=Sphingopyxis TaxID=165697 RepID=UPI0015C9418E|nr:MULTISPECIES: class I adenylate-forming enzyme family protein [Sphingopyxis]NYF33223.1 acyl-CoA synthetase (AMP-forming)/AMP-acid ligase II [Sphingopyxis sp. JAI108]
MTSIEMLDGTFATLPDLVRAHAAERPDAVAAADAERRLSWSELDQLTDRIAARLQEDGFAKGDRTAIAGLNSVEQMAVILGTLRAGGVAGLVTNSATGAQMAAMIADTGARHLFLDSTAKASLDGQAITASDLVAMDGSDAGTPLDAWLSLAGTKPAPVDIGPEDGFNIIYSSGTTGTPKGIVHSHAMRWQHIQRGAPAYGPNAVTILSTPLYSNTTMASFMPTVGSGGQVVLMKKFDARGFLELAERERATNCMLVPVQYRRIMALDDFGRFDLSSFVMKYCTSAPFPATLKADVLERWPGGLVEIYGMTEGGAAFILEAHQFPDKLHTVGTPAPGHIAKVIDEEGKELPQGSVGEVVGRSPAMMTGYNNRPDATKAMHWYDSDGNLFYRHGDIGRMDEDGFLTLMDRAKDMIISGGFNIFPSDLEAILIADERVVEAAVVGMPSEEWGETPVAFVVLKEGADAESVRADCNTKVGKTQRLSAIRRVDELPRSPIGKVLKRKLRDAYAA